LAQRQRGGNITAAPGHTMIIIQTPAELNQKVNGGSLKRRLEAISEASSHSSPPAAKKKLSAGGGSSCHHLHGTIYEARLGPLSPATTLPPPASTNTRLSGPRPAPAAVDRRLQAKLLQLLEDPMVEDLVAFLEEHAHRVDMNQYGEDGVTPLQRLCQAGGPVGVARLLVRYGADVRLTSRDGWSPLHMASFAGNTSLILYLLSCRR
jgi:hypothetical protein